MLIPARGGMAVNSVKICLMRFQCVERINRGQKVGGHNIPVVYQAITLLANNVGCVSRQLLYALFYLLIHAVVTPVT